MARCRHKFELTVIECPMGCGGTRKPQSQVAKVLAAKPEKMDRQVSQPFTDEQLRDALEKSASVVDAMRLLGAHFTHVRNRAKAVPEIWEVYKETRRRGRASIKKPTLWGAT